MIENFFNFLVKYSATIALLFFFSVFCYVVITLLKPKQEKKYKDYANIPFKDSDKNDKEQNKNK